MRTTSMKHLYQLSFDDNEFVRGEVARNWFTPREVLETLRKDPYEWVQVAAQQTIEKQGDFW